MNLRWPLKSIRTASIGYLSVSTAACAGLVLVCCQGSSAASAPHPASARPHHTVSLQNRMAGAQQLMLHLHHLHTGETLDVVYKIGDKFVPGAVAKLNYFLRDHRTNAVSHYDPKEFDLLHSVMSKLGRPNGTIDVVCGYRTPWSNNYLRTRSDNTGVAKTSQHMQAKAIDIRVPGVATRKLRDVALSLKSGGVGYYPVSQFVHVDVGPVRQWTFSGAGE